MIDAQSVASEQLASYQDQPTLTDASIAFGPGVRRWPWACQDPWDVRAGNQCMPAVGSRGAGG